ncbi:MAG TPA: extracellular solute-binding protein [Methylomirabilota bacterium]|jgi:multiple sugar transport system substrate-binding protein|nr:extracellular solute-binding protein [Methylomirabilota bacterium]
MRRLTGWLLAGALTLGLVAAADAAQLTWWSHWAVEDSKKAVLFEAKRRFEARHPGHTVEITFYEKKNMWPALRAAFTAGSGFPDVFYYDQDVPEFVTAGWLADLSTGIRWENIEPYGKAFWTRPGPGGKVGTWAIPVEAASDEIYYNKKLFRDLGITVPATYVFTQDQFKDVVARCTKAGLAAFATGAADREWAAMYIPDALLLSKLGYEDSKKLYRGELSWKDPRVAEVFRYYKELVDLGAYAKTLTSMTLAEAHRYFHTEQKACMFPVGSWYTGRAFVPPEKGGQPQGFELGLLNNPLMKDGKGHGEKFLGVAGSLAVAAKSPNLPLAIEVANAFADVEIGNMWMAKTGIQTGIKTDPGKIDSPIKWYFDEFAKVNKTTRWVDLTAQAVKAIMKPGVWETYVATVNQGLPNRLIGADEALAKLEDARLKGK